MAKNKLRPDDSHDGVAPYSKVSVLGLTSSEILTSLITLGAPSQSPRQPLAGANEEPLSDGLRSEAFASLGRVPRQEIQLQIEQLPLTTDSNTGGHKATDMVLGALRRLADRFLEWRGDRGFLVGGRRPEV